MWPFNRKRPPLTKDDLATVTDPLSGFREEHRLAWDAQRKAEAAAASRHGELEAALSSLEARVAAMITEVRAGLRDSAPPAPVDAEPAPAPAPPAPGNGRAARTRKGAAAAPKASAAEGSP